jgi:hypothetical protein
LCCRSRTTSSKLVRKHSSASGPACSARKNDELLSLLK